MTKDEIKAKIKQNVVIYNKQLELSDYLKEKVSEIDKFSGSTHIDTIVDNVINQAKLEEEPRWTKLLFDNLKTNQKETTQINVFADIASKSNESIEKLVGSSTSKSSIKDII